MLHRKKLLVSKIESTYSVDAGPAGTDAILTRNLKITPLIANLLNRDLDRTWLSNDVQLHAGSHVMVEFEVEIAGAGTAGSAAPYGSLLRACGFSQTLNAAPVTGTAQAGAASSITLAAAASATTDAYKNMLVRITSGTGSGQSRVISAYNGTTKVATVYDAWTTNPDATSQYSIDAQAVYAPISANFEAVTLYTHLDGQKHALLGCRGSVAWGLSTLGLPVYKFKMIGLWVDPASAADPTPTLTGFQQPVAVFNGTTTMKMHGATYNMIDVGLDIDNNCVYRAVVGQESVQITDRSPKGNITIEAPNLSTKNWFTTAKANTLGSLELTHGTVAGNIVYSFSPQVQVLQPQYGESDNVATIQMGLSLVPLNGNDETILIVK